MRKNDFVQLRDLTKIVEQPTPIPAGLHDCLGVGPKLAKIGCKHNRVVPLNASFANHGVVFVNGAEHRVSLVVVDASVTAKTRSRTCAMSSAGSCLCPTKTI